MKKIFTLGFVALCATTLNAQIMQVHSDGAVVFEKDVDAIEQVTFTDVKPTEVSLAFKSNFITMEKGDELNVTDVLLMSNVDLADITLTSSHTGIVAIADGKLVAKDYGSSIITATSDKVAAPIRLYVSVETGLMYIEDVFSITGRGTVVTGTILTGKFKVGETVIIGKVSDEAENLTSVVTGIEKFRKTIDEAGAGDNVGLLLRDVEKTQIERGDVIMLPQNTAVVQSKKIRAKVYVMTKAEGGRHTPFMLNYRPQLYIGGKDVTCVVTDLGTQNGEAVEMVMPGTTSENMVFEVQNAVTPFIFRGQECPMREGGKTIGIATIIGY